MGEHREEQSEQELARSRQATLRALAFVHSQEASLTDHITGIQQKIRCLEQDLEIPSSRRNRAA
jgi:hypothetical protein